MASWCVATRANGGYYVPFELYFDYACLHLLRGENKKAYVVDSYFRMEDEMVLHSLWLQGQAYFTLQEQQKNHACPQLGCGFAISPS